MAKGTLREVQCYHCRAQFEVSPRAMTVSCPSCYKQLRVDDIVVSNAQGLTKLQTCGRIIIQKKGRVRAELVEAHLGIEVHGTLDAAAASGGPVLIGPKANWRGDLRAPALTIEPGAVIRGGFFTIATPQRAADLGLEPPPGVVVRRVAVADRESRAAQPEPPANA